MPRASRDSRAPDDEWVRDSITLVDATQAGVRTKYTDWLRKNAGAVRNVVRHRIKHEQGYIARPRWSKSAFLMTVEFEKQEDGSE